MKTKMNMNPKSVGYYVFGSCPVNISDEELKLLDQARSAAEWNAAVDQVKVNHGGHYPGDWWSRVMPRVVPC